MTSTTSSTGAILMLAFGVWIVAFPVGRLNVTALAIGFGAVTAVLWEFIEYVTFIPNSAELETAYTDTLGDLALGLSGSILAALLTATLLWTRQQQPVGNGRNSHER